jgi:hypothetical protein
MGLDQASLFLATLTGHQNGRVRPAEFLKLLLC